MGIGITQDAKEANSKTVYQVREIYVKTKENGKEYLVALMENSSKRGDFVKIKQIEYRETKSHDFNNFTVGMTADLEENKEAIDLILALREDVRRNIADAIATSEWDWTTKSTQKMRLENEIISLREERKELANDIAKMEGLKIFLKAKIDEVKI